MKTKLSYFLSLLIIVAVTFCLSNTVKSEEDMSHCLVKYKSEWNQPCSQCKDYSKSYRVYFRNECENKIDVKCWLFCRLLFFFLLLTLEHSYFNICALFCKNGLPEQLINVLSGF